MRRLVTASLLLLSLFFSSCTPAQPAAKMEVISHPDGPLYVGDQVSFEVLAPAGEQAEGRSIQIQFKQKALGSANFDPYGLGAREQATFWWVWDTRDLKPGRYTLTFTSQPDGYTWNETFSLHPADQVPPPEPGAHWASTTTICCDIHYITGTAAERDLASLEQTADEQAVEVSKQLGASLKTRITLTFMPRLIGHGGFTWSGVYISYLDGNPIGNDMPIVLHHEFVHYYDAALGGEYFPSIFQEGLAVYLSGGHFKPELLSPRAAALLDLGWYIPLTTLANDFYNQQHDIGYLEAGSLIQYLVETYGWGAFNEFYRTIPQPSGQDNAAVIDSALHTSFGVSFADLEAAYLAYLRSQPVTDDIRTDLRLTVEFFNAVRHYQAVLDPSAYFLTAWLPDGSVMQQRGIVADFLRHPNSWKNQLEESLLSRTQKELFSGDYQAAERDLKWTNWVSAVIAP